MIRALIVDDEKPARDRLRRLLDECPDVEIAGEADNGLEALRLIDSLNPDLVFLDVQMPELDGLEVARALANEGPQVVFATAFDQYAVDAFDAAAVDYLVKPIEAKRLQQALERYRNGFQRPAPTLRDLLSGLSQKPKRLALKVGSRFVLVDPAQIVAVVAEDHYAVIKGPAEEILCDDSLDAVLRRLPGESFMRVHRSAIINLNRLASLDREGDRKYFAIMDHTPTLRIPVSRERIADIKGALGIA